MASKNDSLRANIKTRGAVPQKVSDLINDVPYVSEDRLNEAIFNSGAGYRGLDNPTAKVIVNNIERTIEVLAVGEDFRSLLPKDSSTGKLIDGEYSLLATVSNGEAVFSWVLANTKVTPNYYGLASVESLDDLTSDYIINNCLEDGVKKEDKEYSFSADYQRPLIAYPMQYGELNKIIDSGTGLTITSMFEKLERVINGVGYYVYIAYYPSTGEYRYKFSY